MTQRFEDKYFGKSSLWLPKDTIITRNSFVVGVSFTPSSLVTETKSAPFTYAIAVNRIDGFENDIYSIMFGKLVMGGEADLQSGSYKELMEKGLVRKIDSRFGYILDRHHAIASNSRPAVSYGDQISVDGFRKGSLYQLNRPLMFENIETLE